VGNEYEHIRYEMPAEHVARVVLNRPQAANALSADLLAELDDAVERINNDDEIRVWLLTGAPRPDGRPWFSAGVDMKEALSRPEGPQSRRLSPLALVDKIDDLLTPSIAVIDGVCTTGALEIVLACDLRFAASTAQLSDWHMKTSGLGIGAWGVSARLSRLVGVDKAKELLLMSEVVDGDEAKRIGLVNRSVPSESLMDTALAAAVKIAGMPRRGVRTTLGYLSLQAEMSKRDAMRWGELTPEFMGITLRPFSDAASRFYRDRRAEDPDDGES